MREIEIAQNELANAFDSVELQHMGCGLVKHYQRLAAKPECDGQFASAVGTLNALLAMVFQPQLDTQLDAHFRGRYSHQVHRH